MKLLTKADIAVINEFLDLDSTAESSFIDYFLNDREPRFYCFGNDTSCISIIENEEIPVWSLSRIHSANVETELLNHAIQHLESKKIYQIFTLNTEKEFENFKKILTKYQPYIEHQLPPNSLTGYENIDHDVLEYKVYDEPMLVILWVLRNEYRT
jgi:hypothetical protein